MHHHDESYWELQILKYFICIFFSDNIRVRKSSDPLSPWQPDFLLGRGWQTEIINKLKETHPSRKCSGKWRGTLMFLCRANMQRDLCPTLVLLCTLHVFLALYFPCERTRVINLNWNNKHDPQHICGAKTLKSVCFYKMDQFVT